MENCNPVEYLNTPNDYLQSSVKGRFLPSKPKNNLDYLAFKDAEYETYKLTEKIKSQLVIFNFDHKFVQEIVNICKLYISQFKLSVLLPIVIYKIIQKYNLPLTNLELANKINFDKANYLKYSSQIIIRSENKPCYKDNVYNYILFIINKLSQVALVKPRLIKYCKYKSIKGKEDKNELEDLFNEFHSWNKSSGAFEDIDKIFKKIKVKCKEFIYSHPFRFIDQKEQEVQQVQEDDEEDDQADYFDKFFEGKINDKQLSISIIKLVMKQQRISINSKELRDIFAVSLSSIAKGISLLKEYDKLHGLLLYSDD